MNYLFNKKVLYLIPILFLIVILLRISFAYNEVEQRKYDFALKEAEVLNSHALAYRSYYQKLFINKSIPLNKKTLYALPAFSSYPISKTFSQDNKLNINIQTVSDRARNSLNNADMYELKAIEYFKNNIDKTQYFSDENIEFYQFAHVLKIEKKCLKCHGKKEDAPIFIQEKYENSYDYKIGEIRGIQSIKIPKDIINSYFIKNFIDSIIYDITLFIVLFIAIYLLIKKTNSLNIYLQNQINIKTNELRKTLITDRLTNLPNRLQLIEDIQRYKNSSSLHLGLINIDRFREINDFYGHKVGDIILQELATIISSLCGTNNLIYKLPSDEFAILSKKKITQNEFHKNIQSIIKLLNSTNIDALGYFISISVSSGISSDKLSLLPTTDMALQVAKKNKKDIVIYDHNIDNKDNIENNINGIALIKDAIENDRFTPFFQPIYNMHTKKIEKYEALARIIQEDGTIITPFQFLDIAIKSKLYPHITKVMIEKSFEYFKDKEYEFSINLSIEDILNKQTHKFIVDKIKKFPTPQKIVFEILESDKVNNYEIIQEFIKDIKQFGCKFAIDDFGSGYSNFAHILELNIDYLKIDASLVKLITTDENSRVITKTIINFASSLGLKTIAEYVEDKEGLELLDKLGADYIQGYYIGKPQKTLQSLNK